MVDGKMAFYDNVKEKVRNEAEGEEKKEDGDNMAFDELMEKAKERKKPEEKEEETDDTKIEDLASGNSKTSSEKYGDPSKLELDSNDDINRQAGKDVDEKEDSSMTDRRKRRKMAEKSVKKQSTKKPSKEQKKSDKPADREGKSSEEDLKSLLEDIRKQNEEMLGVLRGIKKNLDKR
ncbi:MAG: hypothetical protein MUP58_02265 [Candidatus Nanohaloarchaeota archaeon QJJ-9]|nr:hypothetical protein [Candidatus Nanohaloarchaeota archaeon QJJ-9]